MERSPIKVIYLDAVLSERSTMHFLYFALAIQPNANEINVFVKQMILPIFYMHFKNEEHSGFCFILPYINR